MLSLYIDLLGALVLTVGGIASNSAVIMIGQVLTGFGSSGAFCVTAVLIADYSGDTFR